MHTLCPDGAFAFRISILWLVFYISCVHYKAQRWCIDTKFKCDLEITRAKYILTNRSFSKCWILERYLFTSAISLWVNILVFHCKPHTMQVSLPVYPTIHCIVQIRHRTLYWEYMYIPYVNIFYYKKYQKCIMFNWSHVLNCTNFNYFSNWWRSKSSKFKLSKVMFQDSKYLLQL